MKTLSEEQEISDDQLMAGQQNSQDSGVIVRTYQKPVLQVFGDVRDITLGPTTGLGESGCECVFRAGSGATCPIDCSTGLPVP